MKQFIISSKNRVSGSSSNFTITSNYPYQTFSKIKLVEAIIPVSYTNCTGSIVVTGSTSGATVIAITPDKYSMETLKVFLQNTLVAQKVGQQYSVTYTTIGLFTIASTTETFTITFTSENASVFGFPVGTTTSASSITSAFSAISALQIDGYINVCCTQVTGIDNGTIILRQTQTQDFILESIIACDSGVTKFRNDDESPWVILPNGKLPSTFYLTFTNGSPVDLNGADWSIKVKVSR